MIGKREIPDPQVHRDRQRFVARGERQGARVIAGLGVVRNEKLDMEALVHGVGRQIVGIFGTIPGHDRIGEWAGFRLDQSITPELGLHLRTCSPGESERGPDLACSAVDYDLKGDKLVAQA